jgi:alkyl hydroperoxide reductase subunit AhpC
MGGSWTLGELVPDIEADSTMGHIKVRDYCKGGWTVIFSHPGT